MRRRRLLQSLALAPAAVAAPPDLDAARITVTGDASHGGPDEERARYLRQFFELLKGRSIYDIEWLRARAEPEILKGPRFASAAIALRGIEQALWDIRGKPFSV